MNDILGRILYGACVRFIGENYAPVRYPPRPLYSDDRLSRQKILT